jgi:hypothetical protein
VVHTLIGVSVTLCYTMFHLECLVKLKFRFVISLVLYSIKLCTNSCKRFFAVAA